jgi:non-homologous end joining protein Ku
MPGPQWKGYLKLSLVSCPIALYPAISTSERVSFRQVNKRTGNRLRHQLVDSMTGEAVERHAKGRGYQIGENEFLVIEDHELEAAREQARGAEPSSLHAPPLPEETPHVRRVARQPVKPAAEHKVVPFREADTGQGGSESRAPEAVPVPRPRPEKRTIDIETFVPRAQMDPRYFEKPYYIVPRDLVGQEAFALIREAMRRKDVAGIGRVVIGSRERLIAIEPAGLGMRGTVLRYSYEVRNQAEYFAGIPTLELPEDMLRVAEHIVDMKAGAFDPAAFDDRERTAVADMLRQKQRPLPSAIPAAAPSPRNLISLMDALKKSVREEPGKPAKHAPKRAASVPQGKQPGRRGRKTG